MEDPRISRMYAAMIRRGAERALGRFSSGQWLRSSVTWIVLLVGALIGIGVLVHEKGRGDLTKLKKELGTSPPAAAVAPPQPGGQDAIVLSRAQQMAGITPEFLSATLLPGRGMNILQITAFLPGKGEVPLLQAPSLAEAAKAMSGIGEDVNGQASLTMGAAIEVPWAGQISGSVLPGGTLLRANWHTRALTLPVTATPGESLVAAGGLLLKRPADSAGPAVMPDGGVAQATFEAGNFDARWPSNTEVKTNVLLSGRSLDLTVLVHNVGTEPEPMGIGWRPRFALAPGDRAQMRLRLPSAVRAEGSDRRAGPPTGRLLPVEGTAYDFSAPGGAPLGDIALNDTFVHLRNGSLSSGPEAELRNPAAGYGIRLTVLSASIKAIRVSAPADANFISLDPQTHYDDPLGAEWSNDESAGLVMLQPGDSLQWKIRLELFSLASTLQEQGPIMPSPRIPERTPR